MVSISKSSIKPQLPTWMKKAKTQQKLIFSVVGVLLSLHVIILVLTSDGRSSSVRGLSSGRTTPWLRGLFQERDLYKPDRLRLDLPQSPPELSESYNAIAADIIETLDCAKRFNRTDSLGNTQEPQPYTYSSGRDGSVYDTHGNSMQQEMYDFETYDSDPYFHNARDLFCLVASTSTLTPEKIEKEQNRLPCGTKGDQQTAFLDLWSSARAQMTEELLLKTLDVANVAAYKLLDETIHLWGNENGYNFILNDMHTKETDARSNGNSFLGLSKSLGPDHLFVDVGSGLGTTALAVILQYPKTRVVSIEPASPNWLLQQLNFRCNLEKHQMPTVILAGIGPHAEEPMAAKFLWRPYATTATRSWNPVEERSAEDVELFVHLQSWKNVLTQANVYSSHHIDVLHVDCEGCEYNLVPALTEPEFESIEIIMGEMHWGYIPIHKLPSSERGQHTHKRLCQHENFARTAKECCGELDVAVRSSFQGKVKVQEGKEPTDGVATVGDVIANGLCDDFDEWADEHHFYDSENDFGWFEMSSVAT